MHFLTAAAVLTQFIETADKSVIRNSEFGINNKGNTIKQDIDFYSEFQIPDSELNKEEQPW
jgi:hypothetical protein